MASEAVCRRYQGWYALLLRLYPAAFHAQFGESMADTFLDLCRERGTAWFALRLGCETLAGIVKENVTIMKETILRVALGALGALLVPLVASQVVEGWNWPPKAFVLVYVLFFLTGMAYALIARRMGAWAYKAGVGVALLAGFVMGWANMVHLSESDNPAFFVYFGVLLAGAAGAWLAKLEAGGMARVLFAMAALLAAMDAIGATLWMGGPSGLMPRIVMFHVVLMTAFAVSGLLFRRAHLAGVEQG